MATYTPNYNLGKPEASDPFGNFRQLFNDNMDEIDANLGGGGGGGGHTIVDENGSDMPAESKLQFTGNVSVTDDNVNGATVVDVLGGGGNVYGAFVDTNRILLSTTAFTGSYSYTATEDCFVCFYISPRANDDTFIQIDGENVGSWWRSSVITDTASFYVRKGQTISVPNAHTSYNSYIWVYGITQGTNGIYAPVIYSDNERVIGVWRDNKPLYAKTLNPSVNVGSNTLNHGIANLEKCIRVYGVCKYNNTSEQLPLPYVSTNTAYAIACGNVTSTTYLVDVGSGFGSIQECYLTFFYTKTTDVAGSGNWNIDGVPTHHYSTSEQVIGTWLGKPLYERVLELTQDTNLTANTWVKTEFNQTTMKALIKAVAVIGSSGAVIEALSGGFIDGKIALNSARNVGLNVADSARLIVQYTKSTD